MRNFFLTQARTARTTTFRHRLTPALLAIVFAGAAAGHSAAAADRPNENAVTHWNVIATNAFIPSQGTNPMAQSRTLAILHAAIHDALNAIEQRELRRSLQPQSVAQMVKLLNDTHRNNRVYAGIHYRFDAEAGMTIGIRAAERVLERGDQLLREIEREYILAVLARNAGNRTRTAQELGAPVTLRIYPGANHADPVVALSRPFRSRLPVLADAAAFLRSATELPTSPLTQ